MSLQLDDLMVIHSEHTWIELSREEEEKAWQFSVNQPFSNAAARWTAFVNYLCLNTLITWLQEDTELYQTLTVSSAAADLASVWEVVNGTALTLDSTRLVIIPSDKSSLSEFQIPQEWVDIPNWVADYYLAVQLNLTEHWLRIWGYTTYQQIKSKSNYDPVDRIYSLDRDNLIEDINIMWLVREFCPRVKPEVQPLPALSPAQVKQFLDRLGQWTPYSPRRDLIFEQWGALLAVDANRHQLYQHRLVSQKNNVVEQKQATPINLSKWLQNVFEKGWQSIETMSSLQQKKLDIQFRGEFALNEVCVQAARLLDLGMQLGSQPFALLVGLIPKMEGKAIIRVQLHPSQGEVYLPPNVRLVLLSECGTILQQVQSRNYDNYIQLKRFKSPFGKSFSIQVILGDVSIKEDFVLEFPSTSVNEQISCVEPR
ncbi:MAG: DUF1822 family protein [Scytonema sp. PMC 1069.18]|nr:DUF1822 family protein [Scytonema sp. PMC 1069.18]MEC4884546.1 DUF1822 family protein [Scytonema sp. PMC 1070.18]